MKNTETHSPLRETVLGRKLKDKKAMNAMDTLIFSATVITIFLLYTVCFRKIWLNRNKWLFLVLAACYLVSINYYFVLVAFIARKMQAKHFDLQLGHAPTLLVILYFGSYITGIFIILESVIRRGGIKKLRNEGIKE